jgi:hypothetical protein
VQVVNAVSCEPDDTFGQGAFQARVLQLSERLGASFIGATVYEMGAREKLGPYHFHHGFEEWLYVVSGAPLLRDPAGERTLRPGELVAFCSGPAGAHTTHGPGRVVMFSAGEGRGVRLGLSRLRQDRRGTRSDLPPGRRDSHLARRRGRGARTGAGPQQPGD